MKSMKAQATIYGSISPKKLFMVQANVIMIRTTRVQENQPFINLAESPFWINPAPAYTQIYICGLFGLISKTDPVSHTFNH